MNPKVTTVKPLVAYKLELCFQNGEKRIFDVEPYLNKGIFNELKDESYFKKARVVFGSIEWPNEQDFCTDTLYLNSESI